MDERETEAAAPRRGLPLVATWGRWALASATFAVAIVVIDAAYRGHIHSPRPIGLLAPIGLMSVFGALIILALLRAEESRLARELRTARAGTSVLRAMAIRQRQQLPFFANIFSTRMGTAAVLLAEGDRPAALDAFAAGSRLMMRGGRLDALRAVVDADLERATGTSVGLERCVGRLRAMAAVGNREADLYRIHVLVKAVLQQGDPEAALEIVDPMVRSKDDEERVYATWLRVWFGLDETESPWTPITEGEVRVAALAARAHGAERLVEMLEQRLAPIARPQRQE